MAKDLESASFTKVSLQWLDVSVSVPDRRTGKQRTLLHPISGDVKSGSLLVR